MRLNYGWVEFGKDIVLLLAMCCLGACASVLIRYVPWLAWAAAVLSVAGAAVFAWEMTDLSE